MRKVRNAVARRIVALSPSSPPVAALSGHTTPHDISLDAVDDVETAEALRSLELDQSAAPAIEIDEREKQAVLESSLGRSVE